MSLNFPAFPARGERFTSDGRTFVWNGSVWILTAEAIPWATMDEALAATSNDTFMSPETMRALIEATEPPPPDFGPLTCVAWARWTASTGVPTAERNIASIVPGPEGVYAFTFRQPVARPDYIIHGACRFSNTAAFTMGIRVGVDPTVNGFTILSAFTGGSGVVGTPRWGNGMTVAVFQ